MKKILEAKKEEVAKMKKNFSVTRFSDSEFFNAKHLDFRSALKNNGRLSIIAEIKKESPSAGRLAKNFDYKKLTDIYSRNNADAISILTDKTFFKGDIIHLCEIAATKSLPLLRKDFIIDEIQIYESKANGADAVLLISEALSKPQITELTNAASELNMDVLLEVHSLSQLPKIDFNSSKIIGINNRNLETFEVNLETTAAISESIGEGIILVSESGIKSLEDINFIKSTAVDAVLVGELLMKSDDIERQLKILQSWCKYES